MDRVNVNAKKLKNKLTLSHYETVIKALGIRVFSKSQSQWVLYNADCHKKESEQTPKLYFYIDTHIFVSYTRGYSTDIIGIVQAVKATNGEECDFLSAIDYILQITGLDPNACQRKTVKSVYNWEDELSKYVKIRKGETALKIYDSSILEQLDHSYYQGWIDEGISEETLEKYKICYYKRCTQICIPCQDELGRLIGIRARNLDPDRLKAAKYIPLSLLDGTTYKFPTNEVFYGINYNKMNIERTGHVTLVEGEKSVLKADTFLGNNSDVLALYGSNIGLKRVRQLVKMGVDKVTLALDSDFHEVGDEDYQRFEKKILSLAQLFKGYCSVDVCYNNIGLTDWYKCSPFDGTKEQYELLYNNKEIII